jgi:hypothetical protein
MRRFIERMLWKMLSVPFQKAVNWTEDDKKALDHFSRTLCGIKLFELLRQVVASTTFKSVYHNSVSENARARGMQDLLAVMYRLRSFSPEAESVDPEEDVEPLPSQREPVDGRRWGLSGGSSIKF